MREQHCQKKEEHRQGLSDQRKEEWWWLEGRGQGWEWCEWVWRNRPGLAHRGSAGACWEYGACSEIILEVIISVSIHCWSDGSQPGTAQPPGVILELHGNCLLVVFGIRVIFRMCFIHFSKVLKAWQVLNYPKERCYQEYYWRRRLSGCVSVGRVLEFSWLPKDFLGVWGKYRLPLGIHSPYPTWN